MKPFLVLLTSLFITETALAQTVFTSLDQVLEYADKNSKFLQQSKMGHQLSRIEEALVQSGFKPRINFYSTADYYPIIPSQVIPDIFNGGNGDHFRKVQFGLPLNFTSGLEFSLPVLNFEKGAILKQAALETEQLKWKTESDKDRLHQLLIELYYKLLMTKELLKLNKENETVSAESLHLMELRKKEGTLNQSDYNRAKNLSIDLQTLVEEYEKAYQIYLNAFKSLTFIDEKEKVEINGNLTLSPFIPEPTSANQRAAVIQASFLVKLAEQGMEQAQKRCYPKLLLTGRYYYQYGLKSGSNSQSFHFDAALVGLRLDYSIFNGGYNRTQKEKAKLQFQSAQLGLEITKENVNKEQRDWWIYYTTAKKKALLLDQKVQTAGDNLRIAELSMKEGVIEYDQFSNIFMDYIKVRIDRLQNLSDAVIFQTLLTQKN